MDSLLDNNDLIWRVLVRDHPHILSCLIYCDIITMALEIIFIFLMDHDFKIYKEKYPDDKNWAGDGHLRHLWDWSGQDRELCEKYLLEM